MSTAGTPPTADTLATMIEMIAALETGAVGALELLDAHLDRIDRMDGDTNAVVTIEADWARTEAQAIDDARAHGNPVGPLAGVPITIKDALATHGIRSTGGAIELTDHIPTEDAAAVTAVREAGAVVFGKTNIPRWSGDYQSYNEIFGTTNNPWDLTRTPGGSSGGPAAAVAMGFSAFEIGTDIGGSVRLPSSFCGIYGHKPSFGVIPTHGYLDSVDYHRNVADVNVFGPMARSIEDLMVLFDLLAAPNPDDAVGWRLELPPPRAVELEDFRVVAWLDDPFCPVDPAVAAVQDAAVAALESAGARIDYEKRPDLDPAVAWSEGISLISAATDISEPGDPATGAAGPTHREWDVLHRRRGEFRQRWAAFFADVDVLLAPVCPVPPFQHIHSTEGSNWEVGVVQEFGDYPYRNMVRWNALIGSAYLPVTVPPIGRTPGSSGEGGDLPIGIQVVAPYLHDRTALEFARAIEPVLGGFEPPPLALG